MATVWYATREDVKRALDAAETARNNAQVDRAIEAASRFIDGHTPGAGFLHRRFYPWTGTRYFDWPGDSRPWRLWLDAHELISVSSLTSGGAAITSANYLLRPDHGPPYNRVEINLGTSATFGGGTTYQRNIAITGVFGFSADDEPAGALAADVSSTSATTVDVSDSAAIGVGHIVKADSERMIVTEKAMLTTAQTLQTTALTASAANVTVNVTTGTAYAVGEVILLDSERMLVVDISGNALTVKRAWDGTVLAAHNTGVTIYAPRRLTVARGALGTTAATHTSTTAVTRHAVPGLVRDLCVAEALSQLLQETGGYARTVGADESERIPGGRGLRDIRERALAAYGRNARSRAV